MLGLGASELDGFFTLGKLHVFSVGACFWIFELDFELFVKAGRLAGGRGGVDGAGSSPQPGRP